MAFIMEQAGGMAHSGKERILDIQPKKIHDRAPVVLGSKEDVEECLAFIAKYDSWKFQWLLNAQMIFVVFNDRLFKDIVEVYRVLRKNMTNSLNLG